MKDWEQVNIAVCFQRYSTVKYGVRSGTLPNTHLPDTHQHTLEKTLIAFAAYNLSDSWCL